MFYSKSEADDAEVMAREKGGLILRVSYRRGVMQGVKSNIFPNHKTNSVKPVARIKEMDCLEDFIHDMFVRAFAFLPQDLQTLSPS